MSQSKSILDAVSDVREAQVYYGQPSGGIFGSKYKPDSSKAWHSASMNASGDYVVQASYADASDAYNCPVGDYVLQTKEFETTTRDPGFAAKFGAGSVIASALGGGFAAGVLGGVTAGLAAKKLGTTTASRNVLNAWKKPERNKVAPFW
jgi:hypothetical protein